MRNGEKRFVWLLSFLRGRVMAEVRPHTLELLRSLGSLLGNIDLALQDFSHPAAARALKWDLAQAGWIREYIPNIDKQSRRALVEQALKLYESQVIPQLPTLRKSVIYGDANDCNVLVSSNETPSDDTIGVIGFGDMHHGLVIAEPAVAAAYAAMGKGEPLSAAAAVLEGFHAVFPLEEGATGGVDDAHRKAHADQWKQNLQLNPDSGSNVRAPLDGKVHIIADNPDSLDYGPVVVLKHVTPEASQFFTLYGHLSKGKHREALHWPVCSEG
ncbi:MAG: phosphotransferase [Acidobacteria bacterium]|nr:phosphotransferase [Acidobacteriota bacterium]